MKLRSLKVEHFRCVRRAELAFHEGLNVLYGPNDLGKSSLAQAVRAALLLNPASREADVFFPWDGGGPPHVALTFETEPQRIWRIEKTFGDAPQAFLYESRNGVDFHLAARGRDAQGKLTDLLRWGLTPPGGRGGPRGIPTTFLSQALLAEQDRVGAVFEQGLEADSDESGKQWLTQVLDAVAEDPFFKAVFDRVQAKVDEAFSSTGRRRHGKNSPWVRVRDEIQRANDYKRQCDEQRQRAEAINLEIAALREQQTQRTETLGDAKYFLDQIKSSYEQTLVREEISTRLAQKVVELKEIRETFEELTANRERLEEAIDALERGRQELDSAERELTTATELQRQREKQLEQLRSGERERERLLEKTKLEKERSELYRRREESGRRLEDLVAAQELGQRLQSLHDDIAGLEANVVKQEAKDTSVADSRKQLQTRERELAMVRRFLLRKSAQVAVSEAERKASELTGLRDQARSNREEAERLRLEQEQVPPPSEVEFAGLRELYQERQVAEAAIKVGLSVAIDPKQPIAISVSKDDGETVRHPPSDSSVRSEANRSVRVELGDLAIVQISGGSPQSRQRFEELDARWRRESQEAFKRTGVETLDELSQALEASRNRSNRIETLRREAAGLDQRIADQPDWEQKLPTLRRQLEEAERDLDGHDPTTLESLSQRHEATAVADVESRLEGVRNELAQGHEASAAIGRELAEARATLDERRKTADDRQNELESLEKRLESSWREQLPKVQSELSELDTAISELDRRLEGLAVEQDDAVPTAEGALDASNEALTAARQRRQKAGEALNEADRQKAALEGGIAQLERAAAKLDEDAAVRAVRDVEAELEAAPKPAQPISEEQLSQAQEMVDQAAAKLKAIEDEVQAKRGALQVVGGSVAQERAEQAENVVSRAHRKLHDMELDYEAWQLLRDTLRDAEQDEGGHLGRALAEPIAERFRQLTRSRYERVVLGPALQTEGVHSHGELREVSALSVGTRDQLSTIFRLALAERLRTAVLLDDQLTQSDSERMDWLRDFIEEVARSAQVVVFTCRPGEYLRPEPKGDFAARSADLVQVIERLRE